VFGVVFRGAAYPSPPVGGPALKCLKVACRTVNVVPRSLWEGSYQNKAEIQSQPPPAEVGFWVACAGYGWPRPVVATTPRKTGACFSSALPKEGRSGRCLSRRSNPPYHWGYLNPCNWKNRGTASLCRLKSAKKDRRPLPKKTAEKSPPEGVRTGPVAEPRGLSPSLLRRSGEPLNVGLFFLSLPCVRLGGSAGRRKS